MNNILLVARKFLGDLEIKTELRPNCLAINRKDVTSFFGGQPDEAYLLLIKELKAGVSTKLYYGGVAHNDEWLFLESF